jgi:hypothetical protein
VCSECHSEKSLHAEGYSAEVVELYDPEMHKEWPVFCRADAKKVSLSTTYYKGLARQLRVDRMLGEGDKWTLHVVYWDTWSFASALFAGIRGTEATRKEMFGFCVQVVVCFVYIANNCRFMGV